MAKFYNPETKETVEIPDDLLKQLFEDYGTGFAAGFAKAALTSILIGSLIGIGATSAYLIIRKRIAKKLKK